MNSKLTRKQVIGIIGDQASFVRKMPLPKMALTRKMEFLMLSMRIYIIVILIIIVLSVFHII